MFKQLTQDEVIRKFIQKHGNKYDYSKVIYLGTHIKVCIICPIHGEFWQTPANHLSGQNCVECRNKKNSLLNLFTLEQFIEKARAVHGDKYDYSLSIYSGKRNLIKIICPEHGEFLQLAGNHLKGRGCPTCHFDNKKLTKEQFINRANKIHNNFYDYSLVVYKGCFDKIIIICPIHGQFEQVANYHLCGNGCKKCKSSNGEKIIAKILEKNNINYKREYKLPNYNFKYDFYLPDYNLFIEFHGEQHYRPIDHFGGIESFKELQFRDNFKKSLAREYKIPLIEFNYKHLRIQEKEFENIILKNILKNK